MNMTRHPSNQPRPRARTASPRSFPRPLAALALACLALSLLPAAPAAAKERKADGTPLRVGTYDSRALAVAYIHSDLHAQFLKDLRAEHEAAKAADDADKIEELAARGQALQDRAHKQVFGDAPVDNILDLMEDALPEIAKEAGVGMVVRVWDVAWQDPAVRPVDITDQMVAWFDPDRKALKIIKEVRKRPPIPVEQLEKMKH